MRGKNDGLDGCRADAIGNRLLKVVAAALAKACKSRKVGRWEGGTFAVLLDRVTLDEAAAILHGAFDAVAAKHIRVRENDASLRAVTITAGVTADRQSDAHTVGNAASP